MTTVCLAVALAALFFFTVGFAYCAAAWREGVVVDTLAGVFVITLPEYEEMRRAGPSLIRTDMHKSNAGCSYAVDDPLRTVTSSGGHALVAPTLVQTGYGERPGQDPRSLDLHAPLGTVVGCGVKHAVVAAFLARHYGERAGGWNGGVALDGPAPTVTTRDHNSLVAAALVNMRGEDRGGRDITAPTPTITAQGNHLAEVRAFLTTYYGEGLGSSLHDPSRTVTARDRFGLVTVAGVDYAIADIGLRMLQPRELFRAQGFHDAYVIDLTVDGKPLTKTAQVRMAGNSVCPPLAAALVRANVGARRRISLSRQRGQRALALDGAA